MAKNKDLILAGNNEIKFPIPPDFIDLKIIY